jgi:hypothetical protein
VGLLSKRVGEALSALRVIARDWLLIVSMLALAHPVGAMVAVVGLALLGFVVGSGEWGLLSLPIAIGACGSFGAAADRREVPGRALKPDGTSVWLGLAEPARSQEPVRWQRVMWHPALATIGDSVEILVHGDTAEQRRVAVELPGGVRLVPVGRLRHRPPRRVHLAERAYLRADLADAFFIPDELVWRPARPWWRSAAAAALVGVALGIAAGLLVGGAQAVFCLAIAGGAVLLNKWTLAGVEHFEAPPIKESLPAKLRR